MTLSIVQVEKLVTWVVDPLIHGLVLTVISFDFENFEDRIFARRQFQSIKILLLHSKLKNRREKRFSYRVGCGMVNRIEQEKGMDEVRKAFYMDADEFVERYDRLLDAYR